MRGWPLFFNILSHIIDLLVHLRGACNKKPILPTIVLCRKLTLSSFESQRTMRGQSWTSNSCPLHYIYHWSPMHFCSFQYPYQILEELERLKLDLQQQLSSMMESMQEKDEARKAEVTFLAFWKYIKIWIKLAKEIIN